MGLPSYHPSPALLSFFNREDYSHFESAATTRSCSSTATTITSSYGARRTKAAAAAATYPLEFEDTFSHPPSIKPPALHLGALHRKTQPAPCTPGRPVFTFTTTNSTKPGFPSKWEDAQKWLMAASSPKSRLIIDKKLPKQLTSSSSLKAYSDHHTTIGNGTLDGHLKEPTGKGFLFNKKLGREPMKDVATEITPLGSSTTSRCHTPFKSISPIRHNTPENRSGPLTRTSTSATNITQLQECHFAKQFDSVAFSWSSKEEEEEDVLKSLRKFEITGGFRRSRASAWEEEEKTKYCLRYQREEAKIQAWLNLQSAKAEAQSRELEVKIQKMRWNLEEKLMKKMAAAERQAEEWRETAKLEHSEQMRRATYRSHMISSELTSSNYNNTCVCFPCTNTQT